MIDLLKELLPILLSGYLALNIFRFRTQHTFTNLSGEKYIMSLVAWGVVIHILFLVTKILCIKLNIPISDFSSSQKELYKLLFYGFTGSVFGAVLGEKNIWERIKSNSEMFKSYSRPQTSTELEELFLEAIDNEELNLFIIELETRKVYVGPITSSDVKDDVPFEEKTISVKPYMSGLRCLEKAEIKYEVFYFSDDVMEKLLNYDESFVTDFDLAKQVYEQHQQIEDVVLFQNRIVSIRKFNPILYKKFYSKISVPLPSPTTA